MQIKNPSNKAITDVKIYGVSYSIDAEGTLENVPEEHARYWQSLHSFLILRKDKREEPIVDVIVPPAPKVAAVEKAPEVKAPAVVPTVIAPVSTPKIPSPAEVTKAPVVDLKNEIKKGEANKVK